MITLKDVHDSPTVPEDIPMKDFELAVRELIDSYRNTGHQQNIATLLHTQAELVEKDDLWPTAAEQARRASEELGIQPPRPTPGEMKHALAAEEAAKGGRNLGIEPDVIAPATQEDMEPRPDYNPNRIVDDPQTPWDPGADQGKGTADPKSSAEARKEATADTREGAKEKSKK
jgi:hypothetical protein